MTRARTFPTAGIVLAAVVLALGTGACKKADRLLLLDVRSSGGLDAGGVSVRFSASGWPVRSVAGALGPQGLLFGYYGPPGDGAVTVTAEVLDSSACVLGAGVATVLDTASGAATAATVLFVRPRVAPGCASPDAGADAAVDAGADAAVDAGADGVGDAVGFDAPVLDGAPD